MVGGPRSRPPGPIVDATTTKGFILIVGFALVLLLVWFIPYLIDLKKSYAIQAKTWNRLMQELIEGARKDPAGLTVDELKQLGDVITKPPSGIQG